MDRYAAAGKTMLSESSETPRTIENDENKWERL